DEFDFDSELEPVEPAAPAEPAAQSFDASGLDFEALMAAATGQSSDAPAPEAPAPAAPEPAPAPTPAPSKLRRLPKTGEMPAVPASAVTPEVVEVAAPAASGPVVLRIGDQEVRAEERPANILPDELQRLRERARAFAERPAAGP